jgi:hypothetical protein
MKKTSKLLTIKDKHLMVHTQQKEKFTKWHLMEWMANGYANCSIFEDDKIARLEAFITELKNGN